MRSLLNGLHSRYNRSVVEQAAIAGVLNAERHRRPEGAEAAADYIARRLDVLAEETERGWEGRFDDGEGFHFERTVRGVKEGSRARSGASSARPTRASSIENAPRLQDVYAKPAMLRRKERRNADLTARSACSKPSSPRAARA